jgi:hypothetical protein
VWKRFGRRCFRCGKVLALDDVHLDHTRPLAYATAFVGSAAIFLRRVTAPRPRRGRRGGRRP